MGLDDLPENQWAGSFAFNTFSVMGGLITIVFIIGFLMPGLPLLAINSLPVVLMIFAPQMLRGAES